jgi:hypothetical protein
MMAHDKAYLVLRALTVEGFAKQARERGEEFHPSNNFSELSSTSVKAQALIQQPENIVILRLRWTVPPVIKNNDINDINSLVSEDDLDHMAAIFFSWKKFIALPIIKVDDVFEKAYYQDFDIFFPEAAASKK